MTSSCQQGAVAGIQTVVSEEPLLEKRKGGLEKDEQSNGGAVTSKKQEEDADPPAKINQAFDLSRGSDQIGQAYCLDGFLDLVNANAVIGTDVDKRFNFNVVHELMAT